MTMHRHAPELLSFSDRSFCEAILKSLDVVSIVAEITGAAPREREALHERFVRTLSSFVDKYWDPLYSAVTERDEQGKPTNGVYLSNFLHSQHWVQLSLEDLERAAK